MGSLPSTSKSHLRAYLSRIRPYGLSANAEFCGTAWPGGEQQQP